MSFEDALSTLEPLFMIVSFIFGSLVGSFANVCVSRWPAGESVVSPRSRCPKCKNQIAWYDNIPILSWILLGAKCRNCSLPIHWQYPLVEGITGVLFLLVFWNFGFVLATPVFMILAASMVIVTFQDLADWTIPNEITLPGIPIGLGLSLAGMMYANSGLRVLHPMDAAAGIALGGGILYSLDRITVLLLKKPGMGFGDVKLLAMLGAFLGWKAVLGIIMLASVIGSVVGVGMILYFKQRAAGSEGKTAASSDDDAKVSDEQGGSDVAASPSSVGGDESDDEVTLEGHYLPFGPYLAISGLVWMFVGPEALAAYIASMQMPPTTPLF